MNRIYIIAIFLLVIALIFAIQNTDLTAIHFLFWNFQGSQALITIIVFITGFLSGWLIELRKVWMKNNQIKGVQKKLNELQKTVNPSSNTGKV